MVRHRSNSPLEVPDKLRIQKARIDQENVQLFRKLGGVKSSIPKLEDDQISQYRRFASKYAGEKPKLDPLVHKKVQMDVHKERHKAAKNKSVNRSLHLQEKLVSQTDTVGEQTASNASAEYKVSPSSPQNLYSVQ